jgi:cytochrome c biogenesis protein CcmG/thiol:disulfide interchange protein DsbE
MKNKFLLLILLLSLVSCFFIFYKSLNNSNIYIPKTNSKKNLPVFKAKDFTLNTYIFSEKIFEEDKYYIVNIWASWCVPCRKEHPLMIELSKNQSVKLIGLNYKDNLNNAKKFISELGNPYSLILIDEDGTLAVEFGAYGVPETFLIDKNKIIIKKFIGPINKKLLE